MPRARPQSLKAPHSAPAARVVISDEMRVSLDRLRLKSKVLAEFEAGGETEITKLAIFIVSREQAGGWTLKKDALKVLSVENGTATVKERKLPASVILAELAFINRTEAKYESARIGFAAVNDSEFEVWRVPLFAYGDDVEIMLDGWKSNTAFSGPTPPGQPAAPDRAVSK